MTFEYKSIYLDKPIITDRGLDIFEPANNSKDISVIFVHGGGWRAGSRQEMHKIMEGFCDHGFICASFDYRLAGVNAFNQLTDLRHAYDYFISFLKERKLPLKTVTFGSSAGAHLSALLALAAPGECGEELEFNGRSPQNEWVRPLGSVFQAVPMFFEPWEDIFPQIWNSMQGIAGVSWREHPEVYKRLAPMEYINAGTQPLFFMNASDEHMFPHRYTLEAAEKLRSFGAACLIKNYENAEHGFFYDLTRRQQKQAFSDMLEFIANFTD